MMKRTHPAAFTLVELAVVMTIIALLIGGILKGQQMIENAKLVHTIKQIESIEAASAAFLEQYSQKPGDMTTATSRLPGCAPPNCQDGNGDSVIGLHNSNLITAFESQAGGSGEAVETTMFWTHLLRAGLISSITGGDPMEPQWGETHPPSPLGGGIHIGYMREVGAIILALSPEFEAVTGGHFLVFTRLMCCSIFDYSDGKGSISPYLAYQFDKKFDNADPFTGNILSGGLIDTALTPSSNKCMPPNHDPSDRGLDCVLAARLSTIN